MQITVKKIQKHQIHVYLKMLLQRAKWLESINQPMWNIENLTPENLEKQYPHYIPYLIYLGAHIIGGFVLLEQDRFLWSDEENKQSAFYIHKLVIKPEYAGKGYAQKSLFIIKNLASLEGVSYLRLDCYEDRVNLLKLYEDCGFNIKRRTVMNDGIVLRSYELSLT